MAPQPEPVPVAAARRTLAEWYAVTAEDWAELSHLDKGVWAGRLGRGLRDVLAAYDARDARGGAS